GGVPALDVRPRAEPHDALSDAKLGGEPLVGRHVSAPEHDQPGPRVHEFGEAADRGGEALALEAAAGEQHRASVGGNPGGLACDLAVLRAQPRMEASEIDAVIDDGQPRW